MRLRLKGGRVLDTANGENAVESDVEILDGRIVAAANETAKQE